MTVTIGGRATSQQRRESVSRRMSALSSALEAFDAQLAALPPGAATGTDVDVLRRAVRALLPSALEDAAFAVTVTAGSAGAAVRVHHCAARGAVAEVVTGPAEAAPEHGPEHPRATPPTDPGVAAELAELLRRRWVRPR